MLNNNHENPERKFENLKKTKNIDAAAKLKDIMYKISKKDQFYLYFYLCQILTKIETELQDSCLLATTFKKNLPKLTIQCLFVFSKIYLLSCNNVF